MQKFFDAQDSCEGNCEAFNMSRNTDRLFCIAGETGRRHRAEGDVETKAIRLVKRIKTSTQLFESVSFE
jgi:hypothetical protein